MRIGTYARADERDWRAALFRSDDELVDLAAALAALRPDVPKAVTVAVTFERPKGARPPSKAAARAEARSAARASACVDRAVRALSWPPSPRRDSFTTVY